MGNATLCACGCGRVVKARPDGRQQHYIKGHSGRAAQVGVECAICGKPMKTRRSQLERSPDGRMGCSPLCRVRLAWARRSLRTCLNCGAQWTRVATNNKGGKTKFCSLHCFHEYRKTQPDSRIPTPCVVCGAVVLRHPSELRISRNTYCSPRCRKAHIVGAGNPSYTSGLGRKIKYGPHWRSQRRAVLERDGYRCQHCGAMPANRRHLHVHHVIPFRCFNGDWEAANQPSNLITLCLPCHKRAEREAQ